MPNKAKRAFFATLTATKGKAAVWPINARTGKRRKPGGSEDLDELFGGSADNSPSAGIRPSGRAPRGQGAEYRARRSIAGRIDTAAYNRDRLRNTVNSYRGQKNRRAQITHARLRIAELDKAISAASGIANGPGDWLFKQELVNGIFDYVSQTTRR